MPPPLSSDAQFGLPTELLLYIFENADYGDFAALSRCSRLFHQIYNPLLYRNLHIHTPIQLAKLSSEERIAFLLGNTNSMLIDDWVLSLAAWEEISNSFANAHPMSCLIKIWKVMHSLRWLQVCWSDTQCCLNRRSSLDNGGDELSILAADPRFLPRLAFVISQSNHWSCTVDPLWFLIHGRRLIYSSEAHSITMCVTTNYENLTDGVETSLGSSESVLDSDWDASGRKFVEFVESALCVPPQSRTSPRRLILHVRSHSLGNSLNPRHIYPWMVHFLSQLVPVITLSRIRHLELRLDGVTMPNELFKKDDFSELIERISPRLTRLGLSFGDSTSSVDWIKLSLTPEERRIYPNFPHWAPLLNAPFENEIYTWWIESLNLNQDVVGMGDLDLQDLASKLNQAFRLAYHHVIMDQGMIAQDLRHRFGESCM
ncbi:unnamed protein product [Rhizoctonia solani]|uniref:F-box domain-containing protein n=1 Tax=Rhizoctonia solani TaxID=456999 RepID=A0A8H3CP13_9AGAM|nr:unnamed protein product [Rhizoctonia solani]